MQVGAFRDPATAKRVTSRLESQKYRVQASTTSGGVAAPAAPSREAARSGSDRYDVFVATTGPGDVVSKLAAKGLSAEPQSNGAVVKPSLPLRDAVALSKDLASDGFKVQVKRARAKTDTGRVVAASSTANASATLHRVRVGAFSDRAAAASVLRHLVAQGYSDSFIARETK